MDNESQWKESEGTFSIGKIIGALISNLPWFIGSVIITFIVAFLYLRYRAPIYQVSAEILIKDDKSPEGMSNEALLQQLGVQSGMKNINNEMRVLNSHRLVACVVKKLHLNVHYSEPGRVVATELFVDRPFDFIMPEHSEDSLIGKHEYKLKKRGEDSYNLVEFKDAKKRKEWIGKWGDTLTLPIGPVILVKKPGHNISDVEYTITLFTVTMPHFSCNCKTTCTTYIPTAFYAGIEQVS